MVAVTFTQWSIAVQALTLMIVYVLTTLSVQFIGFLISRLVDYQWPTMGLMTFLIPVSYTHLTLPTNREV